jgi:hypothetical protein
MKHQLPCSNSQQGQNSSWPHRTNGQTNKRKAPNNRSGPTTGQGQSAREPGQSIANSQARCYHSSRRNTGSTVTSHSHRRFGCDNTYSRSVSSTNDKINSSSFHLFSMKNFNGTDGVQVSGICSSDDGHPLLGYPPIPRRGGHTV